MTTAQRFFAASLSLALSIFLLPAASNTGASDAASASPAVETTAQAQTQATTDALQRGYRTGYSDGYQSGWSDSVERRARDYRGKEDYRRGERAYTPAYGALEDYRDGYQQGFEAGYTSGFDRRGFDSTVPATLRRRGATATTTNATTDTTPTGATRNDDDDAYDASNSSTSTVRRTTNNDDDNSSTSSVRTTGGVRTMGGGQSSRGAGSIPTGTTLTVELSNRLSSDISQRGDPFEARVVEPRDFEGATVSGRVTRVRRAGKVKGTAELQLSFDQIRYADGRMDDFSAQVVEVVGAGDDAGVGRVDPEGGVRGRDSTRDDAAKVGASAGIGAIIGAIAGGGKGAAIGAAIGGAAGTGGVMTQRGKDIQLERGQQLLIRTNNNTRID